jgi:glucokinase
MPGHKFMNGCILAADIGATKTNIGLFRARAEGPERISVRSFKSCAEAEFVGRVKEFLAVEMSPGELLASCFGVAGPVVNGRVVATNLGLELDEKILQRELSCSRLNLVNDLVATAAALPGLKSDDVVSLQSGAAQVVSQEEPVAILAPGTGLGMAFLVDGRQMTILSSEGGHADFAPRDEDEVELWRYLKKKFGRVSCERILSGPGLVNIFTWLRQHPAGEISDATLLPASGPGEISGADVVAAAVAGDLIADRSLEFFTSILGGVAGNLVLTGMAAGGLYLAGGIPAKIIDFLSQGQFLIAFNAKGRMSAWLKQVPVKVVLNPEAALLGAARMALKQI